ncbi:hypothetical protein J3R30DRAFT_209440 [Lentinula aciculospora]|uniref:Uncharacterized protein n=1 Tax=Lentinula aciculospora TaxID=153920 RepID=A0A9W9DMZ7_9AGAR|nr:hypothetical protein J3R30DRAFT_209440 [Lentinula aciculospora]
MAAYFRSWLTLPAASSSPTPSGIIPSFSYSTGDEDDGSDTEKEDNDTAPAFPSLNSAQRMQSIYTTLTDTQLMPPPAAPNLSSGLAVPLTTTKSPVKSSKKREKVALAPGHSPLDWAALKSSGKDLRVRSLTLPRSERSGISQIHGFCYRE